MLQVTATQATDLLRIYHQAVTAGADPERLEAMREIMVAWLEDQLEVYGDWIRSAEWFQEMKAVVDEFH